MISHMVPENIVLRARLIKGFPTTCGDFNSRKRGDDHRE